MRILVINWQDRTNPQAGGAEVHVHELFGRLAARGHAVTLLCSGHRGAPAEDALDGMRIHRAGRRYTFALAARPRFARVLRDARADVVVEVLNKIPLGVPSWSRIPTVALVHHLFGDTAFREASWPVAWLTVQRERTIPRAYRGVPFQALSESTRDDLVRRGIAAGAVTVIVPGIDTAFFAPDPGARSPTPLLAYVGRLKRYKGVDLILRAFARLDLPGAELAIAGTGDWRGELEGLTASLALSGRVRFLGYVSEEDKRALMRRAWAMALTSPKEGWGITNVEAAACGTPAVASDSPGLRESVRDGETGLLVPHGDVGALAAAFGRVLRDPALVASLGERGRRFAETLTWDRAADLTEAHLEDAVRRGGA